MAGGGGGGGGGGRTQRRIAWTRLRRIEDAKENQLAGQTVSTVRLFARAGERVVQCVSYLGTRDVRIYMYIYISRPPLLSLCFHVARPRAPPSFMFATGAARATDTGILVTRAYIREYVHTGTRIRNSRGD